MGATAAIKIKIMPEGIDTNFNHIKTEVEKNIKKEGGVVSSFEEESIAFGLKALIVTFAWPEEKDTELAEALVKKVQGVSNADIIDYRRAIG